MKTTLTIEQSAELIKRGVKRNKASGTYVGRWEHSSEGSFADPDSVEPLFTLADLLSLLPSKLYGEETDYHNCELHIQADKLGWNASYIEFRGSEIMAKKFTSYGFELINTLFSLLCKLIDNHIKLD